MVGWKGGAGASPPPPKYATAHSGSESIDGERRVFFLIEWSRNGLPEVLAERAIKQICFSYSYKSCIQLGLVVWTV